VKFFTRKDSWAISRAAWLDTATIATVLLVINSFFSPDDIGWMRLQPSPYFLLPVLIGSRYGFVAGMMGGFTAALISMAGLGRWTAFDLKQLIAAHDFFLGGLILSGAICGELQRTFRKKERDLTVQNETLQNQLRKLEMDLLLLREAKAELERMVATRDSEVTTLDVEIRRLFDSTGDELYQNILLLLNRQVRVSEAALYLIESPAGLSRKALLGQPHNLPEQMPPNSIEMVSLALKHKTPVTIPEFWHRSFDQHKNYLMTVPLLDSQDKPLGVVVVTSLPFISLHQKTVRLVSLICRWASRVVEIRLARGAYRLVDGLESQKIFSPDFFRSNLELSHASFSQHNLPSSVVLFTLPDQPKALQGHLEKVVRSCVRGGDFPAELNLRVPNLAVLFPLCGERGTHIFVERILSTCRQDPALGDRIRYRLLTFDGQRTPDQIWDDLMSDAEKSLDNN
jgi:hypothetical protein